MGDVVRLRPAPPQATLAAWRAMSESGAVEGLEPPECRATKTGPVWFARGRLPGHVGVHSFRLPS